MGSGNRRTIVVLAGPVTEERVAGSVEFVPVPETHAFYGSSQSEGVADHVLALPQRVFALISPSGWSAAPAPELGLVLLSREDGPLEDDIVVPLVPGQSSGPYQLPAGFRGREFGVAPAMHVEAFWLLIDESEGSDLDARYRSLVDRLAARSTDEIHEFNLHWHEAHRALYTVDMWGAAYLIKGGVSDDGFEYFRNWVILQGSAAFGRALADPDSLVEITEKVVDHTSEEYEFEGYPAIDAWEAATGRDLHAFFESEAEATARLRLRVPPTSTGGSPSGEAWNFDDAAEARRRLPRLAARDAAD